MNSATIIGLVNNAALLLALGLIYDMLGPRLLGGKPSVPQFIAGVILGAIGIAVMLNPWEFRPGIIFDTRSVLLSISGLFFGTVPALLAVLMTGALRLYMGGGGAWTGVAVIVTSGGIGVAWRHLRRNREEDLSMRELYLFGIVVHVSMLLCMLSLPWSVAKDVLSKISLPVMLLYPVSTALLGWLLVNRGARKQAEEALRESEEKYRVLVENANDAIFVTQDEVIKFANQRTEDMAGYGKEELGKIPFPDLIHPEDRDMVLDRHRKRLSGEELPSSYSFRIVNKTGQELSTQLHTVLINWDKRPATLNFLRDITYYRK